MSTLRFLTPWSALEAYCRACIDEESLVGQTLMQSDDVDSRATEARLGRTSADDLVEA
jgi:hypothetical protein